MSLDEGVSRFIGRLYECVYDADAWRGVVRELLERTHSRLCFISSVDLRQRDYSRTEFYAPETSAVDVGVGEYSEGMFRQDPSLVWASKNPEAGVCDTTILMPHEDFSQLDYVRWQKARFGTEHWRVLYTEPIDDLSFGLSLHPRVGEAPGANAKLLHKLLFDHATRALRLAVRPPDLGAATEAVIVLDNAGKVLAMSSRAEQLTCRGDGLSVAAGRLTAETSEATARLHRAIYSAVTSGTIGGAGGGVRLTRPSGKPDWLALVSPFPSHLEHLPMRIPAALLRIVEATPHAVLSSAHAELFDLSPRELEVAQAFLQGHSIESLCAALGISRNTAKVHVQSLFRKTGSSRQSELVHLLSNVLRADFPISQ